MTARASWCGQEQHQERQGIGSGATICVQPGTTTELNLADYFRKQKMTFKPVLIESSTAPARPTPPAAATPIRRMRRVWPPCASPARRQGRARILPRRISKEPLGPIVRQRRRPVVRPREMDPDGHDRGRGDGITSQERRRAAEERRSAIKRSRRHAELRQGDGVDEKWMYNVIKQVGNYGESYEAMSVRRRRFKLERGQNALWTTGGLLYADPVPVIFRTAGFQPAL